MVRTNSKEVFLRQRILFFCNLKCAIARENEFNTPFSKSEERNLKVSTGFLVCK